MVGFVFANDQSVYSSFIGASFQDQQRIDLVGLSLSCGGAGKVDVGLVKLNWPANP